MRHVVIRPDFDAYYCSYYLAGIAEVFGPGAMRFARGGFPGAREPHALAFIVQPDGIRVFVDAQDSSALFGDALDWCDFYAKINVDAAALTGAARSKVLAIGPSFAIRIWGPLHAVILAANNFLKSRAVLTDCRTRREHFANYWRQSHYRLPLSAFEPARCEDDYVFFLTSLWRDELDCAECNGYRANFIRACRDMAGIRFEGGFAPRPAGYAPGFDALTVGKRYTFPEYLAKVKRSIVAFSTPAVYRCHGWKLAEYLALGKAIISTPLSRDLPAPLEHGTHLHIVDGSIEGIGEAVRLLVGDGDYRRRLERNARAYFERYLAPASCIERIVGPIGIRR
jgi:hypothetical protein